MSIYAANQQVIQQHQAEQEKLYSEHVFEDDSTTEETMFDEEYDDNSEDKVHELLNVKNKRTSLMDKKRGFGKHRHPWLEKEHDFQDDDDMISLAGMVSLGDSSASTRRSAAPKSQGMRRESRGFRGAAPREKQDDDDDGAAPMAPPQRKRIPLKIPDIPEEPPMRGDEGDGIMRDVPISQEQVAGEAASQRTDPYMKAPMVSTQNLHVAPPPGLSVRSPKKYPNQNKGFFATICPC